MTTFTNYTDAANAAQYFFSENFGYKNGIAIESAVATEVTFYSKDDPAMDDTFTCTIEDGFHRFCKNGGDVITNEVKSFFIVNWDNGSMTRYVDSENSKNGTSLEENAMRFETKEEAELFIKNHGYENCGVSTIEIAE